MFLEVIDTRINVWYIIDNQEGDIINTSILNEKIKIENMIYEIRGKQVMLDSDLAKLYKCNMAYFKKIKK